jgi:O-antigen biosynthesis protein
MASNPSSDYVRRVTAIWLTIRVHLDAFLRFPSRYLVAAKWWLLRKRVRARGHFAPLLSNSPRAYEFWAFSQAPPVLGPDDADGVQITALVRAADDLAQVAVTLKSLAAARIDALVIGRPATTVLASLAEQADFQRARWLMPVMAGDMIAEHAATSYRATISQAAPDYSVIYADDDVLDRWGRRKDPHFKPQWNPELQKHHDILTGACIVRGDAMALAEAALHENWGAWLVTAAATRGTVAHIPDVLHHRRSRPAAPKRAQPLIFAENLPLISVIIPTRNRADLLRTCVNGLRATDYPALQIIIADNGSDDPETIAYLDDLAREGHVVLPQPGPFNYSAINNSAVREARGKLMCLLNNDVEVLSPDWLAILATQAMRPEVGAVGAQLLYPDGRIQHAGVVIGVGNAAGHAHRFIAPEAQGYFRRHALPQFVSAVTGACLVVKKDRYLAVGGLDEQNFAVAYNDVDLCLKLNARGWQSLYEPRAVLVHHESISRGFDTDSVGAARFAGELAALQRIWRTTEIVDPYHHPNLSRASEQFALDLNTKRAFAP